MTGIKLSKEGKSITSLIPDDFLLDSNYPLLKVSSYGTFQTDTSGNATINHNLGYVPFAIVASQMVCIDNSYPPNTIVDTDYYQHDWSFELTLSDTIFFSGITRITSTQLLINVSRRWVSPQPQVYGFYYIFSNEV